MSSQKMNSIEILGAHGTKAKDRGTSSFLLNESNCIDAGNILYTLEEKSASITNIWLTHSHLDHISDIAYILDNFFSLRDKSLNICALPSTIKALQKHFLNDLIWPDFSKIKLHNSEDACVVYTPIELGIAYPLGSNENIVAFKTDHTVPSCGYVYTKNETAVLITADTYSLSSAIALINENKQIKSVVFECSFPSYMERLAIESKHLTPKILFEMMEKITRDDFQLYINHLKPMFIDEIKEEIAYLGAKWNPIVLNDREKIIF